MPTQLIAFTGDDKRQNQCALFHWWRTMGDIY
jgi:hypothetical protein